jgi:hypothetical protein
MIYLKGIWFPNSSAYLSLLFNETFNDYLGFQWVKKNFVCVYVCSLKVINKRVFVQINGKKVE